ncbi:hypothetical protein LXL04_003371 [Taraxacum kok-saghyz]
MFFSVFPLLQVQFQWACDCCGCGACLRFGIFFNFVLVQLSVLSRFRRARDSDLCCDNLLMVAAIYLYSLGWGLDAFSFSFLGLGCQLGYFLFEGHFGLFCTEGRFCGRGILFFSAWKVVGGLMVCCSCTSFMCCCVLCIVLGFLLLSWRFCGRGILVFSAWKWEGHFGLFVVLVFAGVVGWLAADVLVSAVLVEGFWGC